MHADRAAPQVALLTYVARRVWAWLLDLDAKSIQHPAENHFEDPSSLIKVTGLTAVDDCMHGNTQASCMPRSAHRDLPCHRLHWR